MSEIMVLQADVKFIFGNFMKNGDSVVIQVLPRTGRKLLKKFLGFLIPGPPKVAGKPMQAGDQFRQFSSGK
jgi:hypothetical protein